LLFKIVGKSTLKRKFANHLVDVTFSIGMLVYWRLAVPWLGFGW